MLARRRRVLLECQYEMTEVKRETNAFKLSLQSLADIVSHFEGLLSVHDDVYFSVVFVAGMVCSNLE